MGASPISSRLKTYGQWVWIAAIVALFAMHAVHLRADFPNFSPWMDYAKYTDEGWYGNAAIEAFLRGSWYVPGDFNTAVALPVWPFLEWVLFHFTGVNVVAARALAVGIFGGSLLLTYSLVRAATGFVGAGPSRGELEDGGYVALLAATLIASSGFLYCFSRLAILEPLVIFLFLLSWWLALRLRPDSESRQTSLLIAIGLVVCLMVLTKTTAVVLLPSVFYLVWKVNREGGRPRRACLMVAIAAAVPWSIYYFLLVRPHYLPDYKYLFTANIYEQPTTPGGWLMAFWYSVHGGLWMDHMLFFTGVVLVLLSALLARTDWATALWRNPLYGAALLAIAFQVLFIGYHNNMQPRYYMVVAYPFFIVVGLAAAALLRHQRLMGIVAVTAVAVAAFLNARQTIKYVAHPQYTFVNAAQNLTRYIDEHPNGNRLLLSISGNEIGLITGLPAICDDFGTLELPQRIHQYQPGWYAAWNELDEGTLQDLHTQFRLEEVANYPAFDDPDRNVLILYKLHPLPLSQQTMDSEDGKDDGANDKSN